MFYIDPKELNDELIKFKKSFAEEVEYYKKKGLNLKESRSKANGVISEELANMFILLAENLSNNRKFKNYTFIEEMKGKGIYFLCKYAHNYNYEHPKANAFGYISQICYNGFVQCIKEEKKQVVLKDNLIKKSMEEKSESEKFLYFND